MRRYNYPQACGPTVHLARPSNSRGNVLLRGVVIYSDTGGRHLFIVKVHECCIYLKVGSAEFIRCEARFELYLCL